jgi:hypothetical protein
MDDPIVHTMSEQPLPTMTDVPMQARRTQQRGPAQAQRWQMPDRRERPEVFWSVVVVGAVLAVLLVGGVIYVLTAGHAVQVDTVAATRAQISATGTVEERLIVELERQRQMMEEIRRGIETARERADKNAERLGKIETKMEGDMQRATEEHGRHIESVLRRARAQAGLPSATRSGGAP